MNDTLILSLYKDRKHFSSEDRHVFSAPYSNMSCGDEITLHVNGKNKIVYSGAGCSLMFASAEFLCRSLDSEDVVLVDVSKLQEQMLNAFDMTENDKRATCVLLPFRALEMLQSELRKV